MQLCFEGPLEFNILVNKIVPSETLRIMVDTFFKSGIILRESESRKLTPSIMYRCKEVLMNKIKENESLHWLEIRVQATGSCRWAQH